METIPFPLPNSAATAAGNDCASVAVPLSPSDTDLAYFQMKMRSCGSPPMPPANTSNALPPPMSLCGLVQSLSSDGPEAVPSAWVDEVASAIPTPAAITNPDGFSSVISAAVIDSVTTDCPIIDTTAPISLSASPPLPLAKNLPEASYPSENMEMCSCAPPPMSPANTSNALPPPMSLCGLVQSLSSDGPEAVPSAWVDEVASAIPTPAAITNPDGFSSVISAAVIDNVTPRCVDDNTVEGEHSALLKHTPSSDVADNPACLNNDEIPIGAMSDDGVRPGDDDGVRLDDNVRTSFASATENEPSPSEEVSITEAPNMRQVSLVDNSEDTIGLNDESDNEEDILVSTETVSTRNVFDNGSQMIVGTASIKPMDREVASPALESESVPRATSIQASYGATALQDFTLSHSLAPEDVVNNDGGANLLASDDTDWSNNEEYVDSGSSAVSKDPEIAAVAVQAVAESIGSSMYGLLEYLTVTERHASSTVRMSLDDHGLPDVNVAIYDEGGIVRVDFTCANEVSMKRVNESSPTMVKEMARALDRPVVWRVMSDGDDLHLSVYQALDW